ncbi:hypothetical protein HNQ07_002736 [Deinococcus metalli]|uniref:Uncharacterized protein n=1 Tax=Deinococcus metalli TaxID=1141878 RepID=A0A7W8KGB9_9DEIO|nr:hypothetical protein [Deinococcus metalli]MBB5377263.1 hypothetical protein [Deinococcus metalli]GHF47785.1 hypothetical protein GCM10017781_25130 [Deinococcus metalli]
MTIRSLTARRALAALTVCALSGAAGADRTPANLKTFKTVCVNAGFHEQDKENEAIRSKLIGRIYDALDGAKIATAEAPCQPKGLSSTGQLNLYFDFTTTTDGKTFDALLEGWLSKDGAYESVTLWQDNIFGAMDAGSGALEAADVLDELIDGFVKDWKTVH